MGADKLVEEPGSVWGEAMALRTYSARLLGADPGLVLHGGGNTSVKGMERNILGEGVPAVFVQASGHDLKTIGPEGHVGVELDYLQKLGALVESVEAAQAAYRQLAPLLRGALASPQRRGTRPWERFILKHLVTPEGLALLKADGARELLVRPTLTSDHLIRTKALPLWFEWEEGEAEQTSRERFEEALRLYLEAYDAYYEKRATAAVRELPRFDPRPRVILIPGVGTVCAGPDEKDIAGGFYQVTDAWGGLDQLVISAGLAYVAALAEMDFKRYQLLQAVNVEGTLHLLAEAGRHFKRQGSGGDVVLVSTKNVFAPGAGFGAYSATKAASHQLARIASLELAAIDVRVNMVAPDAVFSDGERKPGLWAEVGPDRMKARGLSEEGFGGRATVTGIS